MLSPRAEELLSYFTGLAPVGEPIEAPLAWPMADLRINTKQCFHKHLNTLIAGGYVRRLATGSRRSFGLLVVLRRLEGAA